MIELDMRDIAIIDAFPVYKFEKVVLNVGCGEGRIDYYLAMTNYQVYATDLKRRETWQRRENLTFHEADIFNLESFPLKESPVVIASEVLEHIKDYKTALANLLKLTVMRLIITIPYRHSFDSSGHCNYWSDEEEGEFKCVCEFVGLCRPYFIAISKIITKPQDMGKQFAYLIVVDKRQKIR